MSDNELGAFIRARREAVSPAEVGLPEGPRRRTPGLRRAELATLAGISVEYLTRIEQGRDRRPSAQILGALADALGLAAAERELLVRIAKAAGALSGIGPCPSLQPPARSVRPTVRALLNGLEPAAAVLLNRLSDVLAFTSGYERLAGAIGLLDAQPPNLLRFVFSDARARDAYPEWGCVADDRVASLKLECFRDDPHWLALADELAVTAGAAFTDRMDAPLALPRRTGVERLVHPDAGELRLAYETLDLPDANGQRLVVYLPVDEPTSQALDHLAGRQPGALRAVSG